MESNSRMKQEMQTMLDGFIAQTSLERVGIVRNTCLAASALSTAILIALTQVGAKELSLQIAVAGTVMAAPIWLCLAVVLEAYLHLGEDTFPHLQNLRTSWQYLWLQYLAGFSLYIGLCGVIFFLLPWALFAFVLASFIGVGFVFFFVCAPRKVVVKEHCVHQQSGNKMKLTPFVRIS